MEGGRDIQGELMSASNIEPRRKSQPQEHLGKVCKGEGTTSAKVLRQEDAQHTLETARRPLWLEHSGQK